MHTVDSKKYMMKLKKKAREGNFSARLLIYPREVEIFEGNGFEVSKFSFSKRDNRKIPYDIFWSNAFKNDVPQDVVNYIKGEIDNMPDVDYFAQLLYIITMKALSSEEE